MVRRIEVHGLTQVVFNSISVGLVIEIVLSLGSCNQQLLLDCAPWENRLHNKFKCMCSCIFNIHKWHWNVCHWSTWRGWPCRGVAYLVEPIDNQTPWPSYGIRMVQVLRDTQWFWIPSLLTVVTEFFCLFCDQQMLLHVRDCAPLSKQIVQRIYISCVCSWHVQQYMNHKIIYLYASLYIVSL